jgi:hypothetical protein
VRVPELLAEIGIAAQLPGVRDVELARLLEVRRESETQKTFLVEFPLEGRQLVLDVEEVTVEHLAVGSEDLDGAGLFDDELPIVARGRDHRHRVCQSFRDDFQLDVESGRGKRHCRDGRHGRHE